MQLEPIDLAAPVKDEPPLLALPIEADPDYIALQAKLAKLKHQYWMVRYHNATTE